MENLQHLKNDLEKAEYLQDILISHATGSGSDENEYKELRVYFLSIPQYETLLPSYIRLKRDLSQFWGYIKNKFGTYAERREYIWESFSDLLTHLEINTNNTVSGSISNNNLLQFGVNSTHHEIQKALERIKSDPEGAITLARTILESTCKFIADKNSIEYTDKDDISILYKKVSSCLNLSPEQHSEEIFKQILGGCSGIVNGLGSLRNKFGDAHGKGLSGIKPASRHAELAVNLAGSMAIFLIETYETNKMKF